MIWMHWSIHEEESVLINGLKDSTEETTDPFLNIGKSLALISVPFIEYQEDSSYMYRQPLAFVKRY